MADNTTPAEFATAGNYPAGADAWSGQPRAIEMTASEKANGFTPNTPAEPELVNGLFADLYKGHSILLHRGAQEWDRDVLPVAAGGRACTFNFLAAVKVPNNARKAVIALGYDVNNANELVFTRSWGNGFNPSAVDSAGPTVGGHDGVAGAEGQWLSNNSSGDIVSHTNLGAVKTTTAFSGVAELHYAPGSSTPYIAIVAGSGDFYSGATIAGLALRTKPAGLTSFSGTQAIGTPAAEFADDGGLNVVCAAKCVVSGVDRFRLLSSSDGGLSWAVAHTSSSLVTGLNVTWCAAKSLFVAVESLGFVRTSAAGSSWNAQATIPGLDTLYVGSLRHGTLAAAGHCIAKAVQPDYYTSNAKGTGILYTFDLLNWYFCPFGQFGGFDGSLPIRTLIAANDRFYAIDGTNVYRSGMVAFNQEAL